MISFRSASVEMFSASARKFVMTRWRKTGMANARTSSQATLRRPSNNARAFPARINACDAREPAPHLTSSLTRGAADRVGDDVVGNGHFADKLLEGDDVVAAEDRRQRRQFGRRRFADHFHFVFDGEIVEHDVEEEAVKLRFRKRIGAFQFDWILRREHEKRPFQINRLAGGGDMIFAHGLQQGGLCFRRRAVDFIRQHDVREDGPADEFECARTRRGILLQDFRSENVRRHQVRRELDAFERQREELCDGFDEQCLAEAGHAREQRMAARQKGDDDLVDDILLADNDFGELRLQGGHFTDDVLNIGIFCCHVLKNAVLRLDFV